MKKIAEKLIAELEAAKKENIYTHPIPERDSTAAHIGRMGGIDLAILKIKIAFDIPI